MNQMDRAALKIRRSGSRLVRMGQGDRHARLERKGAHELYPGICDQG